MAWLKKIGTSGPEDVARQYFDAEKGLESFVSKVEKPETRDYIRKRVMAELAFYDKRSDECKQSYLCCMTISIILGALVPIVSVVSDGSTLTRFFTAFLGSGVTAVNAYLALHNSKDLWISYRSTCEELLRTLYFYFTSVGIFSRGSQNDKDARLIETCEGILSHEFMSWGGFWQNSGSKDEQ